MTRSVDEIVAPSLVWEEARPAMESIVRGDRVSLLLPGEPALQCKLEKLVAPLDLSRDLSLDCGAMTMVGVSQSELVRSINEGEVHRRVARAIASNQERLQLALGLEVTLQESAAQSGAPLAFSTESPACKVTFEVLARGRLHAEAVSAVGTTPLEAASYRELGKAFAEHLVGLRIEEIQRAAGDSLVAAVRPALDRIVLGPGRISYGSIELGLSKADLARRVPFEKQRDDEQIAGREFHDRFYRTPFPQFGGGFINLLDDKVVRIVDTLQSLPNLTSPVVSYACTVTRDAIQKKLRVTSAEVTMKTDEKACVIEVKQGDQGIAFWLLSDEMTIAHIDVHGSDAAFAAVTAKATASRAARVRAASCNACKERKVGEIRDRYRRVIAVDRKACTMTLQPINQFTHEPLPRVPPEERMCNVHWARDSEPVQPAEPE